MSVKKAFDILTETLGDSFQFKGNLKEFSSVVTSSRPKLKEFSTCILNVYPKALFVDFDVHYDGVNRRNILGDYKIISGNEEILETDNTLREKNFEIHSKIFDYLTETLVDEVYADDEFEETKYRFYLDTLDYDEIE